jgi:hypothetical protein
MLAENHAPGLHTLSDAVEYNMGDAYRTWWSLHGPTYVASLPPTPTGWERRVDAVRHYHAEQA